MYKSLQVLRTKVPLKTVDGVKVSPKTRVVFISAKSGKAVTRIQDIRLNDLRGFRITASPKAFTTTHRGRPTKAK